MIDRDLDAPGFIPAEFEFKAHAPNPSGAADLQSALERYLVVRGAA